MQLIDTHAHLDFSDFDEDRKKVLERAQESGIERILNIGTDIGTSRKSIVLSQKWDIVYAAVGIHPHNADDVAPDKAVSILQDLAKADRVKAIGEIGLDYHYDNSPRKEQKKIFRELLKMAGEIGLPPIIHSRDSTTDMMAILKDNASRETGGIMHCFAGDYEMAKQVMEMGFYIAVGGIITFNSAHKLRETISRIPLERLLIETDCPYLSPVPFRGKRNEPSYVLKVAEKVAEIKNIDLKKVAQQTTSNAKELLFS